jgi:hypothetical protein
VAWRSQVEDDDHRLPYVPVNAIPFEGFDPGDYTLALADATRLVDEGTRSGWGAGFSRVMQTPGHSPAGSRLLDREAGILFPVTPPTTAGCSTNCPDLTSAATSRQSRGCAHWPESDGMPRSR